MPYQTFSRKGRPSRAGASDAQVYVGNVALLLFKSSRSAVHYWDISDWVTYIYFRTSHTTYSLHGMVGYVVDCVNLSHILVVH